MRSLLIASLMALCGACRATYPAPPARTVASVSSTQFGRTDSGDIPSVRAAERSCQEGLSPRAVSAAFRAVDEVADAVSDLCTIEIVDDDPLVWHVWCGSDATFQSGHYLAPAGDVACDGERAGTAFECIGRILARHLLTSEMAAHVQGVEIVSIGSVDRQRLAPESQFLTDACTSLQAELGLGSRWEAPAQVPSDDERAGIWNTRLSWCRAAFAAQGLRRGMARTIGGRYDLGAIGAGTDWLEDWRRVRRTPCPTRAPGESPARGQCRDARRVDLFVRVRAQQGTRGPDACDAPSDLPGGDPARALYCWSDCQARAAIGRNPEGYQAPRGRDDLLFATGDRPVPEGWIVERGSGRPVNSESVRQLLLRR